MNNNQITENEVIRDVALNDLITEGLQIRVSMSEDTITDYAETYKETPGRMPPIVVYYDSKTGKHYLADGFHRVEAVRRNKGLSIRAIVRNGTNNDAMMEAVKANATNGLRRTKEDEQHAMQVLWDNWDTLYKDVKRTTPDGKPSVRQIMSLCATKHGKALASCRIKRWSI